MINMDMMKFLSVLRKIGYGIIGFNTYELNGISYFYIVISQKGDTGKFYKREGEIQCLNDILDIIIFNIVPQCK